MSLILINPNTSRATTEAMVTLAAAALPSRTIMGLTAPFGSPLITTEEALQTAAEAVLSIDFSALDACEGVIIAAFGDPGLEALRDRLNVPVVGIAEAGFLAAAEHGRRFSVVTTTPDLARAIEGRAAAYGVSGQMVSLRLTDGDLTQTMASPDRLSERLHAAVMRAIEEDQAEAVLIGGGPLATAARALASRFDVPLIEPVPEAAVKLGRLLNRSGAPAA